MVCRAVRIMQIEEHCKNVAGAVKAKPRNATAEFRFYAELNDFLAPERRGRPFCYECARRATTKHAIEALGVPHTEVELILVNGESVDFDRVIEGGDRVCVYPQFESVDVTPLLRVRDRPLRCTRFIADAHLGALARYLRMLGFDTCYDESLDDREIAELASRERRVVLSRDRALLMQRIVTHGCYVRHIKPRRQLEEIVDRLDLSRSFQPFTRCMVCNSPLVAADRDEVLERLPAQTAIDHERFHTCRGCGKVYWPGSHYRRMCAFIERLRSERRT